MPSCSSRWLRREAGLVQNGRGAYEVLGQVGSLFALESA
jgi:hypothetical protein